MSSQQAIYNQKPRITSFPFKMLKTNAGIWIIYQNGISVNYMGTCSRP